MKQCRRCMQMKSIDAFRFKGRDKLYRDSYCQPCRYEINNARKRVLNEKKRQIREEEKRKRIIEMMTHAGKCKAHMVHSYVLEGFNPIMQSFLSSI